MDNIKIAVLIDGDNSNPKNIDEVLKKISQYGTIAIKRVYGDWSKPNLNRWKDCANKNSIRSIQAYSFIKGKNSTDSAIIIDAMDILHSKLVNAFCIVSSDCDFTGLIHRIKEDGLLSIGMGKNCACNSFKEACDIFLIEEKAMRAEIPNSEQQIEQIESFGNEDLFRTKIPQMQGLKVVGKIDLGKFK